MSVHIKLIRNIIKSSSSYGKYFAKAVSQGEVTLQRHDRFGLITIRFDSMTIKNRSLQHYCMQ